jgi:hypothetical protein
MDMSLREHQVAGPPSHRRISHSYLHDSKQVSRPAVKSIGKSEQAHLAEIRETRERNHRNSVTTCQVRSLGTSPSYKTREDGHGLRQPLLHVAKSESPCFRCHLMVRDTVWS